MKNSATNIAYLIGFVLLLASFASCSQSATEEFAPIVDTIIDDVAVVEEIRDPFPPNSAFVIVTDLDSTILADIRYASSNNFLGRPMDGYLQPLAILSRPAAEALARANALLKQQGLCLKIYDAYRPQRAVNQIVDWAYNSSDTIMKSVYYPQLTKYQIRKQGYISRRSKHSMGSTVDLTLADLLTGQELDMGSPFDLFAPISHFDSPQITSEQRANRRLLRNTMQNAGFYPIECEWWHFTLRHQPYSRMFDFPVHADSARIFVP